MSFESNSDGFTVVRRRKRGPQLVSKPCSTNCDKPCVTDGVTTQLQNINLQDEDSILRKIEDRKIEIKDSIFYNRFIGILDSCCLHKADIVCYGLGHFVDCPTASYQLALLLNMREHLDCDMVSAYDPVFSQLETSFLGQMNISILRVNEEGKRCVSVPTVFYMPHCGKSLYNNLLWANWDAQSLKNITIIGNSFSNISTRSTSAYMLKTLYFMNSASAFMLEREIENDFRFNDVFNDFSVHTFSSQKMPSTFWESRDEPPNVDDDIIVAHK